MDKKIKKEKLTLPLGDTIAGPHNITVEVIGMAEGPDIIPIINTTDLIEEFGHGSAKDAGTEK